MGVRRLAYEINYEREAAYYLYTFEREEDFPQSLNVLNHRRYSRWLIVKAVDVETPITVEEAPKKKPQKMKLLKKQSNLKPEETEDEAEILNLKEEADEETEEETAMRLKRIRRIREVIMLNLAVLWVDHRRPRT